jgi:FMN phosphatase YigB (HAD superfamily)
LQRFVAARSEVSGFLYSDSLPCLRMLAEEEGLPSAILTNGNAHIRTAGDTHKMEAEPPCELGALLRWSVHAGQLGAMKPSPVSFIALAQRLDTLPSRVLYVGDSFDHDVQGAKGAGMHSAFLVRLEEASSSTSPEQQKNKAPDTVYTLPDELKNMLISEDSGGPEEAQRLHIELSSLHPVEFKTKVYHYIDTYLRDNKG